MVIRSRFLAAVLLVVPAFAGANHTIIVSAPRLDDLDLMAVDVAADVTPIDRATIEQSGAASVPELLQREANVLVRSTSGTGTAGQLSLRGFGDNSHLRILVLVDGHKVNRPDMGGIAWQDLPVSNIERIEVIRGGQNVLYGNHALSGVVKITTRRGKGAGLKLDGKIGSFGYRSGSASYGETFGDFDYHAGISRYTLDGFRSNSTSRATTAFGSLGWYASDTDTLTFRGSYSDSYMELPGSLTYEQMKDDPTQSAIAGDEASEDQSGLFTLLYETERDWGAARANAGLNLRERDTSLGGIYQHLEIYGVSVAPRVRLGSRDDFFMAGLDLNYDALELELYLDASRDIVKAWAEIERITTSPYLFARRTITEKNILNGGVRYEYAETDNHYIERGKVTNRGEIIPGDSFAGVVKKDGWAAELSWSHQLTERLELWAGYDRVYRYPTFDETAVYQGFALASPLNKKLDPETGNNFELGSRLNGREWKASLTGFCLLMDDEIVFDDVARLNRNMGDTRRIGVETEVRWNRGWYGASTRWTFIDARQQGGTNDVNKVPLVPSAYGITSIWVEPIEQMNISATYTYVSEQYQGNAKNNVFPNKLKAYEVVDLRVNIAMAQYASVYFSINNLFDENYATTAFSGGFYPAAERSFRAGLTLEF